MSDLTVILPAAGQGTRLNLPYPKEILRLDKEQALIDYSFDFFRNYGRKDIQFVVVINEKKTEIIHYLSKYKNRYNISFTYQDPNEFEYTGAIKSAKHLFGNLNVVLLPDTIMTLYNNNDLYQTIRCSIDRTGFSFLFKREQLSDMLKTKGSVFVNDENEILLYEDKPEKNYDRFNAFWCGFSFYNNCFDECMSFMERSTLKKQVRCEDIKDTPIYKSVGIEVQEYKDLGTWEEIRKLLSNHKEDNGG